MLKGELHSDKECGRAVPPPGGGGRQGPEAWRLSLRKDSLSCNLKVPGARMKDSQRTAMEGPEGTSI